MSYIRKVFVSGQGALLALLALFVLAGCETTGDGMGASSSGSKTNQPNVKSDVKGGSEIVRIGEQLTIEFLDINPTQQIQITVPDDGNITLLLGQKVNALNKSAAALREEIQNLYVPKYYKRLTVNIKREARFVYVRGEVKMPQGVRHVGEMTVLKAIAAAGGFTIYADKKSVEITRSTGEALKMNAEKARKNPKLDLPVYPDDQINVPLRIY